MATKTRGPRTPDERARDAERSAATLFEKLPPSPSADELLRPLAVLLRWNSSAAYLDTNRTEEAADAYRTVVAHWSSVEELEASHRRRFDGDELGQLNGRLHAAVDELEGLVGIEKPRPALTLVENESDGAD